MSAASGTGAVPVPEHTQPATAGSLGFPRALPGRERGKGLCRAELPITQALLPAWDRLQAEMDVH